MWSFWWKRSIESKTLMKRKWSLTKTTTTTPKRRTMISTKKGRKKRSLCWSVIYWCILATLSCIGSLFLFTFALIASSYPYSHHPKQHYLSANRARAQAQAAAAYKKRIVKTDAEIQMQTIINTLLRHMDRIEIIRGSNKMSLASKVEVTSKLHRLYKELDAGGDGSILNPQSLNDPHPYKTDDLYANYEAVRWLATEQQQRNVTNAAASRHLPDWHKDWIVERYALATLYFATGGDDHWTVCSRNLQKSSCEEDEPQQQQQQPNKNDPFSSSRFLTLHGHLCNWHGIECAAGRTILKWIDLSGVGLAGTLPQELNLLGHHRTTSITDATATITNDGGLELLWLHSNPSLTGPIPSWIGQDLSKLQTLSLCETALTGSIPDSLYQLSHLTSLRLYNSKFIGTLSTQIGKLSNLSWLWIHGNYFSGTIPTELGQLHQLEALSLHDNRFVASSKEKDGFHGDIVPSQVCSLRTTTTTNQQQQQRQQQQQKGNSGKLEHLWTNCQIGGTCQCCSRCFHH